MKLVIDIPEKAYKKIQSLSNADYFGHDICGNSMRRIANGTPYEERPHGEWIEHRTQDIFGYFHSEYECSKCHDEVWQKTEWQFCPNCGSDNRGEGESE